MGSEMCIRDSFYDLKGEKLEKIRADMAERRAKLSKEASGGAENE